MKRLSSFESLTNLSVFPIEKDNKYNLFEVRNNAVTTLKHSITPTSKYITVESTDKFPENGILRISQPTGEAELIHYSKKVTNQFHHLQRGFAGYKTFAWKSGSIVSLPVMAEHHNVLADAIINIQKKIGTTENQENTLMKMVKTLEERWLTPKISFRAYPTTGKPPLTVDFHNFSTGKNMKFLWDFGDETTSIEENPTHTYQNINKYTVRLTMISANNAQGFIEKPEYIDVNEDSPPFFYISPQEGTTNTVFEFIDQTDMDIVERHWFLGQEKDFTTKEHTVKYKFKTPGIHNIKLLLRLNNNRILKSTGIVNVA